MDSRQSIIDMLNTLSEDQLQMVIECIREIALQQDRPCEPELDEEQQDLLNLLSHTVDTGRGDFAERHDHYLYNRNKS